MNYKKHLESLHSLVSRELGYSPNPVMTEDDCRNFVATTLLAHRPKSDANKPINISLEKGPAAIKATEFRWGNSPRSVAK